MAEPIRLLSWNVWKLFGDPLAVHRVLRAAEPDVVLLQEAPNRWWSRFPLASLARHSGLHVVAGGRSGAGNAILRSPRLRVHEADAVRFRPATWYTQRRGAVMATVSLDGPPVRVVGVHLSLDRRERTAHVDDLLGRLAGSPVPCVIAGDLNEPAGGPIWQTLASVATDPAPDTGHTYSTGRPRRRIDAVLTGPGVETVGYEVFRPSPRDAVLASDHLPVLSLIRPVAPPDPPA